MNPDCFAAEDAADVLAAPATDPRRAHAGGCPRCGALLAGYRAFTDADASGVSATELRDADVRLTRVLAGAIGIGAAAPGPAPAPARAPVPEPRPSLWQRLVHPAMRPALAFGALALVLGGVLVATRVNRREPDLVLRGPSPAATAVLVTATRSSDALHVTWRAFPGADAYELRFYSGELAELGRAGSLQGTHADLPLASLSFHPEPGAVLLVRVLALAGGDVVATSSVRVVAGR